MTSSMPPLEKTHYLCSVFHSILLEFIEVIRVRQAITSACRMMGNSVIPYVTVAESNSLSTNQLGGILPGTVDDGSFVQGSEIKEAGIKFNAMGGGLYAALAYYDQEKSYRDAKPKRLLLYLVRATRANFD